MPRRHWPCIMATWVLLITLASHSIAQDIRGLLKSVTSKEYPGASEVTVFDRTTVNVHETGYSESVNHTLIKLLKLNAVVKRNVLSIYYSPLSNLGEIKLVRVHKKDGRVLDVDLSKVKDIPACVWIIFWGGRNKILEMPHLEIEDAIELKTQEKGFKVAYLFDEPPDEKYIPPMRGHFYDVVYFQSEVPVLEKRYELRLPKGKFLQYQVYNGEVSCGKHIDEDKAVFVWEKRNIKPFKREYGMVDFSDVVPKLVLATVPNWYTKSRWFYNINEPSLLPGPGIIDKASNIIKGMTGDDEKIAALVHWVAQEVRYLGLSIGKGESYIIHPVDITYKHRAGVCKDIAGLLVSMLRAVGYEAYAVMTQAGSIVENIPADQFNHCVAAVKMADGKFTILDPTWAPNSRELWSSFESCQHILIGTPEGRTLETAPCIPPKSNYHKMKVLSNIALNGDLHATVEIDADGAPDMFIRKRLIESPLCQRENVSYDSLKEIIPSAILEKVNWTDPEDFTRPINIVLSFEVPGFAIVTADQVRFTPLINSICPVKEYTSFFPLDDRKYPYSVRTTRLIEFNEDLVIPDGYKLLERPEPVHISGEGADFEYKVEEKESLIRVIGRFTVKHHRLAPETYPDFCKVVGALRDNMSVRFVLVKK